MRFISINIACRHAVALLTVAALAAACGSGPKAIEMPAPGARTPVSPETPDPGTPGPGDIFDNRDATLIAELPADISRYIDPTARLDFTLSFAGASAIGQVAFANGVGRMSIEELPSDEIGDLAFQFLQGGVSKVEGFNAAVTLKSGQNNIVITLRDLTPPDQGGGNGGGGNGGGGNGGGGNGGGGNGGGGNGGGGNGGGGSGSNEGDLTIDLEIPPT